VHDGQADAKPSIPQGFDVDVVLDDFGKVGRAYREVDEKTADRATIIRNVTNGQCVLRTQAYPAAQPAGGKTFNARHCHL